MKTLTLAALSLTILFTAYISSQAYYAPNPQETMQTPAPQFKLIKAVGPGTFYAARKKGSLIGFWIIDDDLARPIGDVDANDPAAPQQIINIDLSNGINGVFFADDIPLGSDFRILFTGTLQNEKCPECTTLMPLPAEPLTSRLNTIESDTKIEKSEDLVNLVAKQKEIYRIAKDLGDKFLTYKDEFVNEREKDLYEFYKFMKTASKEGETKLNEAETDADAFEQQLKTRIAQDTAVVQKTAKKYENFLNVQPQRLERALGCTNMKAFFASAGTFRSQLGLNMYPDEVADEFQEEPYPQSVARENLITAFENNSMILQNQIEPCMTGLLANFLTDGEDVNFPDSVPNLSNETLIAPAPYETLANQISGRGTQFEADADGWQQALEQKTAQLDTLEKHRSFQKKLEDLPAPLLAEIESKSVKGTTPVASTQKTAGPGSSAALSLISSLLPKKPCGNDPFLIINLSLVSVVITTPFDDSITVTGNSNNIILALAGDDCVDAQAGYDLVFGMRGTDFVHGGDDHDVILGGEDDDMIFGGKGNSYKVVIDGVELSFDIGNFISGDAGADNLTGSKENGTVFTLGFSDVILGDGLATAANSGGDTVDGDAGIDAIFGQAGDDTLENKGFGAIKVSKVPIPFGTLFFGNAGADTINGTNIPLVGSQFGDLILGGSDADILNSGKNWDFIFGEGGNDQVDAGDDTDFVFGQEGADSLHGGAGRELVTGNKGADAIFSDSGSFSLMFGNAENDTITGGPGIDIAFGGLDGDTITGGGGPIDILSGGQGNDQIDGQNGTDVIFGDKDRDFIKGGPGTDLALGGEGTDNISGEAETDVIFGNDNNFRTGCKTLDQYEYLNGGSEMDLIWGNTGCDWIEGTTGIDVLAGGPDDDFIQGGDDPDVLWGGPGDDKITGDLGSDVGFGGPGKDDLEGGQGIDLLSGGADDDLVKGDAGSDVLLGRLGNDKLEGGGNPDLLAGGPGNDDLLGGNGSDVLFGGPDNDSADGGDQFDVVLGNAGDDVIQGGPGDDAVLGGPGADQAFGGSGNDLIFGGGGGEIMIDGQGDDDLVFGNTEDDNINMTGGGLNIVFGGPGADKITAFEGANLVFGGAGNDSLDGADVADVSSGTCNNESPREFLFGNAGSNTLRGNKANSRDLLFGGTKTRCIP